MQDHQTLSPTFVAVRNTGQHFDILGSGIRGRTEFPQDSFLLLWFLLVFITRAWQQL
jgi:hypothetical protein